MRRAPRRPIARLARLLLVLLALVLLIAAVPAARAAALRMAGGLLIVNDPIEPADVGVMTESGEAGELEMSELYHQHVIPRVLILVQATTPIDLELARRGVHRESLALTTLIQLRVPREAIVLVEAGEGGTTESTRALAGWVRDHPSRVLVVISPTHARRYRRALLRVWPAHAPPPRVTSPRASPFHVDGWWRQRRTLREGIFELEKLAGDYLMHPW